MAIKKSEGGCYAEKLRLFSLALVNNWNELIYL